MMKIPSLFTRIPKHKKFEYTPLYYNPKEEEMKERFKKFDTEKGEPLSDDYRARIAGGFKASRKRNSRLGNYSFRTAMIRLGILLVIALFIMAYFEWGKIALYGLASLVPLYIYFKITETKKNTDQ